MNTTMTVGSFISFGWETFKKRPWFLIGVFVITAIVSQAISYLTTFLGSGISELLAGLVINFIAAIFIGMGMTAVFLKAHDSVETVTLNELWHPQEFWSFLGVSVLQGIIVTVGFILFIIPGFMALTAFMFAQYFVIDKGMGPIEALKASARITKGNRLRILAFMGATILVMLLGGLALIVGILVAIPVTALAQVHAYRRLSAAADANEARQPLTGGEITLVVAGGILPVTIIIGLLSVVVLASLNTAMEKSIAMRTGAYLNELQIDLELYYDAHGNTYPATLPEAVQGLEPQYQETASAIPLDQFAYSPMKNNSAYQLCVKNPVPEGESQCVSSDAAAQTPVQ
ncbi:MAG: hypothetical protein Q7S05_00070 [bacterium]|nr:hypothetical protein [bacterium]